MENSNMPDTSSNVNPCEDDTDTTSSRKHSQKKQKRKASTVPAQNSEETKTSKTNKWKQSLAQIKQISEAPTDTNTQLVANDHLPTNKWKKSLTQIKQISEAPTDTNTQLVANDHLPTNKWKKSLAQIKQISEARTDSSSQLVQNDYVSTSKWKQSLARIARMSKARAENNSQLVENDQSSTVKGLQDEMVYKNPKVTLNPMQMTLDEKDITRSLQVNEETHLGKDERRQNGVKLDLEETIEEELSITDDEEPTNMNLEDKLDQNDELDIDTTMDLSSLNLTDDEIPEIMNRILRQEKKDYTNLVLRDNALTSIGIKILVDELLVTPRSLRNLGLSINPGIGDAGVEHLVRLLQGSRSITFLALHNTGITNRGVRLLADVLCNTDTNSPCILKKLYISFNKLITDESLESLIRILEHNQKLKVFSLQHCSLSDKARRRLRQICAKKKKRKFSFAD